MAARRIGRQGGPAEVTLHAHDAMPADILLHLPVAIEVARRVDLEQLQWDELVERDQVQLASTAHPRPPTEEGLLARFESSARLTIADLCLLMLAAGDRLAAQYLIGVVGADEVSFTCDRMNLQATRLGMRSVAPDSEAVSEARDGMTSAADMIRLMALLRGEGIPGAARLRAMMSAHSPLDAVRVALPADATLMHISAHVSSGEGSARALAADAGILRGPRGSCLYCVLLAERADGRAAWDATIGVVRLLWDNWCAARPGQSARES